MRIGSGQLAGHVRIAVLISACVALIATTSGLLLAIHILGAEHSQTHDPHDCTICQQLLTTSRKVLPTIAVEWVQRSPIPCEDAPEFVEYVEHRYPRISPPRGPPCLS